MIRGDEIAPSAPGAGTRPLPGVLIIDDAEDLLQILGELLRSRARVRTALTGREGLELAAREEPQVVLLDLMLPEMDGREILRHLRTRHPATEVIIITGQGSETVAAECMKEGAADYIVKPFENRRVLEAVVHAAAAHERRQELQRADERLRGEHALLARDKAALVRQTRELEARIHERTRDLEEKNLALENANRTLNSLNEVLLQQNQTLADLKRSYEELFENATDGLLKTDAAGRILLLNRQAEILCRAALGDLGQRTVADILSPERRAEFLQGLLAVATRRETSFRIEAKLHQPCGPPLLVEFRVTPLMREGAEQSLEIHIENITQRRLDEERLRKLEERSIVAGMSRHLSHVLRNSLTSAGGFLTAVTREAGLTPRGRDAVGIVLREVRKMEEVVRGYQDYVETTKARPAERLDLNALVAAVAAALPAVAEGNLKLTAIDIEGRPAPALLDRRIFQLGLDYLFRGIVRAHDGELRPPVCLELSTRAVELEHRIRAFLPGLHLAHDLLQIMDRPWRHQVLHQTFDYWDLAIAQTMFERHGGQFTVSDQPEGTEYLARLPLLAP